MKESIYWLRMVSSWDRSTPILINCAAIQRMNFMSDRIFIQMNDGTTYNVMRGMKLIDTTGKLIADFARTSDK